MNARAFFVAMALTGCAAPQSRTYLLDGLTVHVQSEETIQAEWNARGGHFGHVHGFAWPAHREIWVRCDRDGNPDLEVLGHEVYHVLTGGKNADRDVVGDALLSRLSAGVR